VRFCFKAPGLAEGFETRFGGERGNRSAAMCKSNSASFKSGYRYDWSYSLQKRRVVGFKGTRVDRKLVLTIAVCVSERDVLRRNRRVVGETPFVSNRFAPSARIEKSKWRSPPLRPSTVTSLAIRSLGADFSSARAILSIRTVSAAATVCETALSAARDEAFATAGTADCSQSHAFRNQKPFVARQTKPFGLFAALAARGGEVPRNGYSSFAP
jgi:hypothetical protein